MRITQNITNRRYTTHLNSALERKNSSERKIQATKRYNRASEDPISAAKALRTRKALADNQDYQDNLATAENIYNSADSALLNAVSIIDTIVEQITYGVNQTQNQEDKAIVGRTIETMGEELVNIFNLDVAGRKIFGGVNNADMVFEVATDAEGLKSVVYNGVAVDDIDDPKDFPYSESSYTDIGVGMRLDPATGRVDEQSALAVTINGAEVLGCGKDENGESLNLVNLTFKAADALKKGDGVKAHEYIDKIRNAQVNLTVVQANIGNKQQYIEYNKDRLVTNRENLLELQNELEGTDMAAEATNWKTLDAIYNVSLQMAGSVIPMSIFQFIS